MNKREKGFVSIWVIAVIAFAVVVSGAVIYGLSNKTKNNSIVNVLNDNKIQDIKNSENDNNESIAPDTLNGNDSNQIQEIDPGTETSADLSVNEPNKKNDSKQCPSVSAPVSGFCPNGKVVAKTNGNCIVGYGCEQTVSKAVCGDGKCDIEETAANCSFDCKTKIDGGLCAYKEFTGKCAISNVAADNTISYVFNPSGAVDVSGTFFKSSGDINPYKGSASVDYLGVSCLNGTYPFTADQIKNCGIVSGAIFNCVLSVQTSGTCAPINIKFLTGI